MRSPLLLCLGAALLLPAKAAPTDEALNAQFADEIEDIMIDYCFDCHGDGIAKGDVTLDQYEDVAAMRADRSFWKSVRHHLHQQIMPPRDELQPTAEERETLIRWIDDSVFSVDPNNPEPGRITARRLNISEYRYTIKDLLGVDISPEDILPPDDSGYGFDQNGDVLSLSPSHLEKFHKLAVLSLEKTYEDEPPTFQTHTFSHKRFRGAGDTVAGARRLLSAGTTQLQLDLPTGRYDFEVYAFADQAGDETPQVDLLIDGEVAGSFEIKSKSQRPQSFVIPGELSRTGATLGLRFNNDYFGGPEDDRNVYFKRLVIYGPFGGPPPEPTKNFSRIFKEQRADQSDTNYISDTLQAFARRAFRRPVTKDEVQKYVRLAESALPISPNLPAAMRPALEAILISPHFLFRELDLLSASGSGERELIPELVLASRISYFLTGSQPDDELLALAEKGELRQNLDAQIERILAEEETSIRFADTFFHQWLQTRNIKVVHPDKRRFRHYHKTGLEGRFAWETTLFYRSLIWNDRPLTDLVNARYTFADDRLAEFYGLPKPGTGREFVKVEIPEDSNRRGVLTQGSVLTITSNPDRTSPVKRGLWVLENILDTPPPPAPPNVPSLETKQAHADATIREQLDLHREDPSCASCHELMDGIGFAFESFTGIGEWRDSYGEKPIDTSGAFASGEAFNSAVELSDLIIETHLDEFKHCVAVKMLTFALGRGTDYYDAPALEEIVKAADEGGLTTKAYVKAVINSLPFQYYRK